MEIGYLVDHQNYISLLTQWFYDEWSYLHPGRTREDVMKAISARLSKDKIPLTLVAVEKGELLGTVCLKEHDMEDRLDLTPCLAGLYVAEIWRNRGIGSALVRATEHKAVALGIKRLYLYTPDAERFYSKLGWSIKESAEYHGHLVTIMEKALTH